MRTPEVSEACLSVVIPAFNEENTIREVVSKLLTQPAIKEIIIVNDCSTDKTGTIAAVIADSTPLVSVITHTQNRGKTAALMTGFAVTTGAIVIVQDADLEYDPVDISSVIEPILQNKADVVYGSRFLVRKAARVLYFYHYLANKGLTVLSNLFTNTNMTDVETGYKAFRGDIIRQMIITSSGFGFEIEVTAKVAKLGCRLYEVPISYYGRTYDEGKKIAFYDGLLAVYYIIRFNLFCSLKSSFRVMPTTCQALSKFSEADKIRSAGRDEPFYSGS